ncbi:SH3 domain-containing protein [Kurthia gibsonii]|uniref:SH3 domain-containing protein n=1 Tax=Kurthia gibsonii TaxID=33946 RepID=UPI001141E88A|nr:SH3 domain-containing protein [Kurthia gibsonii]GED19175.1 putative N-acetylmuramoyl-L-alanine amidase YrvJ [Kurthia gibsonii]
MVNFIQKSKKLGIALLLLIATILTALPATSSAATTTQYKVNTSSLNVRSGPSTNYKVVFTLKKNTVVTKQATKGSWFKIKSGSKTGYVSSKYLTAVKKVTVSSATSTQYKVNAASLNARSGPSTNYKTVFTLKKNAVVTKQATSGTWFKIKYGSKTGYVSSKYLTAIKSSETSTSSTPAKTTYFYVTEQTGLSLRSGAGVNYKSLGVTVPFEAKVKILKENKNNWIQVTYKGKTGWINAHTAYGFKSTTSFAFTSVKVTKTTYLVMKGNSLNVRKMPNVAAPKVASIGIGFTGKVLRTSNNNWVEIEYSNNKRGWVSANTDLSILTDKIDQVGNPSSQPLRGLKFVIDAGHGGNDSGAVGTDLNGKRVTEAELTLKSAKAVQAKIESLGGTVFMTRTGTGALSSDKVTDLGLRAKAAAKYGANAFISLHYNSATPAAEGIETLYYKADSKEFASTIHKNVMEALKEEYNGIKDRGPKFQNVMVLRENTVFATLVELGFISNKTELTRMNTDKYRATIAEGIANGVLEYYFGE